MRLHRSRDALSSRSLWKVVRSMNVLILTHGSRGDVQPFAALAHALTCSGHEVTIGAPASAGSLVEGTSARFVTFDDAIAKWMTEPGVVEAIETNYRGLQGKKILAKAIRNVRSLAAGLFDELANLVNEILTDGSRRPDIVVHHVDLPGHEIAERLGVPAVPVCLQPFWVPTAVFQNPALPFRVPPALNRASYLWSQWKLRAFTGSATRWRTERLNLQYRRGHRNFLHRPDGSPATIIQAFSRHLIPSPMDYPHWVHTTGFWHLPLRCDWTPPSRLSDFLRNGDPPVFVGFGSMVGRDPQRTGRIVTEAVRLARVRAVIVTAWGGIVPDGMHNDIIYMDEVPFDWLFPQMAAIVHHGGSGTTGSATASGRPQVICPFLKDQKFYANRLFTTGATPAPLPQQQLTVANLTNAIRLAVGNKTLASRAAELGERVRNEGGFVDALRALESAISF